MSPFLLSKGEKNELEKEGEERKEISGTPIRQSKTEKSAVPVAKKDDDDNDKENDKLVYETHRNRKEENIHIIVGSS